MSTTNNQSIQKINTAAPSAAPREAHQPDEIKPTTKEISMNAPQAEDYATKLEKVINTAKQMPGTGGARALKKIITDLEGEGPIGELMFGLDKHHFDMVIDLLQEFRRTGKYMAFNSLHSTARDAVKKL
ncbi:MAG: hypothetical protein WAW10_02760 [Gallionella sp.]